MSSDIVVAGRIEGRGRGRGVFAGARMQLEDKHAFTVVNCARLNI